METKDLSLRIALVLNPFTLRRKGGEHAPWVARELLGRGHAVRAFGDVIGGIPQSGLEAGTDEGAAPLERAGLIAFEPDIIVAYDGRSPAALRSARAARRLGVPLILIEEGFPENGKLLERALRSFGSRAWGGLVRRMTTHVIALDPVASAQAERHGFEAKKITILPTGVDLTAFRPGLSSQVFYRHAVAGEVLLHIGRIEPGRGIDTLIDAFAQTVGRRGDWSLVFAGTGSHRAALRAQAERLGIGARVHWTPVPRTAELPGLMGASTALLVPALDDDVASLKIRRAMACGVPVLVSDVGRLSGTVVHDESGLVVPPGDLEAWKKAIARLSSDPTRRARWGRNARAATTERLSWPRIVDRFEECLLHAVLDRRSLATLEAATLKASRRLGSAGEGSLHHAEAPQAPGNQGLDQETPGEVANPQDGDRELAPG